MTVASTFADGLRVPQIEGALALFDKRRMLLADQPGAGKTAQALVALELDDAFRRPGYVTLIMCNVTGCQLTWAPELRTRVLEQYPTVLLCDLTDSEGRKTMPSTAQRELRLKRAWIRAQDEARPLVVLANFDCIRWPHGGTPKIPTLFQMPLSAVLIDEGHLVLPTREDADRKLTQFWRGLHRLRIADNALRFSITGTPDRGKLHNRYGHWKFLHPQAHTNFWGWCRSHFIVTESDWGGADIGKLRNEAQWVAYDHQRMIRRTKAEMLKGMPEKQWANSGGIDLPMTAMQQDAYDRYQESLEAEERRLLTEAKTAEDAGRESEAKTLRNQAAGLKMQFALRGRQMATCMWRFEELEKPDGTIVSHAVPIVAGPEGSNKLAWILNWLDDRAYFGDGADPAQGKVVIVSYFTEVLKWLQQELQNQTGLRPPILSGDTAGVDKQAIEQSFQRGSERIVLLSGHLGVSINLDAADDMIFVDSVHDPDRMEQAEDRIHRASRFHQVTYWRLASADSIDMAVLNVLDSRYRETRRTYEGSRGVAFARRFLPKTIVQPEEQAA